MSTVTPTMAAMVTVDLYTPSHITLDSWGTIPALHLTRCWDRPSSSNRPSFTRPSYSLYNDDNWLSGSLSKSKGGGSWGHCCWCVLILINICSYKDVQTHAHTRYSSVLVPSQSQSNSQQQQSVCLWVFFFLLFSESQTWQLPTFICINHEYYIFQIWFGSKFAGKSFNNHCSSLNLCSVWHTCIQPLVTRVVLCVAHMYPASCNTSSEGISIECTFMSCSSSLLCFLSWYTPGLTINNN